MVAGGNPCAVLHGVKGCPCPRGGPAAACSSTRVPCPSVASSRPGRGSGVRAAATRCQTPLVRGAGGRAPAAGEGRPVTAGSATARGHRGCGTSPPDTCVPWPHCWRPCPVLVRPHATQLLPAAAWGPTRAALRAGSPPLPATRTPGSRSRGSTHVPGGSGHGVCPAVTSLKSQRRKVTGRPVRSAKPKDAPVSCVGDVGEALGSRWKARWQPRPCSRDARTAARVTHLCIGPVSGPVTTETPMGPSVASSLLRT